MPFHYRPDEHSVLRVVGLRCDRCARNFNDPMDVQEALNVSFRAGYLSAWGDGNDVQAALCDACAFAILRPFATVSCRSEAPSGHLVGNPFLHPGDFRFDELNALFADDGVAPTGFRRVMAATACALHQLVLPVIVLARPMIGTVRAFLYRIAVERKALRATYRLD